MNIYEKNGITIVSVERDIMQEHLESLQNLFESFINEKKVGVVLDFSQCNYITSMGLSIIFHAKRKLSEQGGDIKITGVNPLITNLLEMTNLNKTINSYNTIDEAVQSFKPFIKD